VEGWYVGTVSILPFLPPMFSCGDETCLQKILKKKMVCGRLMQSILATYGRLGSSRCDFCFLHEEKVHRCSKCLTKTYCSRECLLRDSKEKHEEFCEKDAEERKVKRDSKSRVDAGLKKVEAVLKDLELRVQESPELASLSEEAKQDMVAVKELCEKKGGKNKEKKTVKRGGKTNSKKTHCGNLKEAKSEESN